MNKDQNQKITQIENLIQETKANLKSWASQIGKYHQTLKELSSQVGTIKKELTMNQPKTKSTKSVK